MNSRVFGCVVALALGSAMPARAESGLQKQGALDGMKSEVSALITLKFDRSAVRLDRGIWEQKKNEAAPEPAPRMHGAAEVQPGNIARRVPQLPAEAAMRRVQAAAQANHSRGMTSNNSRSISFSGALLNGTLETTGELATIRLVEVSEPGRSLEVIDDPDGKFRLLLTANDGDIILINQAAGGATSVACVVGDKRVVASGKNFAEVFSQNREIFEKVVLPAIQHIGVGVSLSANTPQVRGALVSMLTPLTEEENQTAQKLLADLASPDFATRETARERLVAGIDRYRPLVEKHGAADGISKDTQFSIEQILNASDADPTRKLVTEMKLLEDPKFLVSILDALEPDARKVVTAHLTKLTGQSLGDDVAAWQKWAEQK